MLHVMCNIACSSSLVQFMNGGGEFVVGLSPDLRTLLTQELPRAPASARGATDR